MDRSRLPPRLLPILYFAVAHLALALAFLAIAVDPRAAAGFFYHPRMLAIVHLVTVGWITSSILGSLYIVAPVALRGHVRAGVVDYVAFALVTIGVAGMVAHFWIAEFGGMAWSAATAASGILVAGAHIVTAMRSMQMPSAVKAHVWLAFANIAGAGVLGVLMAFSKVHPFLPGYALANVFAHAHLAAIGWAAMMVVGIAYRLLPMVLPAEMPRGRWLWASAVLLQIGVTGLAVALVLRSRATGVFAPAIAAGIAVFLGQAIRMVRRPRPRPPAIPRPDPAVIHAASAFVCLGVATGLGLWLSVAPMTERSLRIAMAYGATGLVGFLSQIVVGMEGRLLPLFAWYWAFANVDGRIQVRSPHDMPWRPAQYIVFVLWTAGIPALAAGLALDSLFPVRAAAWGLLGATVLDTAQAAWIVSFAWRRGDAPAS